LDGDRSRRTAVHDGGHALHKGRGAGVGKADLAYRGYPLIGAIFALASIYNQPF